ncbi:MAG: hypothetical protein R2748_16210 [Bryobacterales bacterium]
MQRRQKNPEVFEEVDTEATMRIFANIRKDVDTLLITGGECLMRGDIEELVRRAKQEIGFRSVLVVTNGVLLDKRKSILPHLNGLIVSLDATGTDRAHVEVRAGSARARQLDARQADVAAGCDHDQLRVGSVELGRGRAILAFCQEHGFQFSVQSSQNNGKFPSFQFLEDERYQAFVDKLIAMRKARTARINGTPKLLETLLRFEEFESATDDVSAGVPQRGCRSTRARSVAQDSRQHFGRGSIAKCFRHGRKLYGETPQCKNNCFLFGNVLSSYYVEDFWGLAGDTIRPS